ERVDERLGADRKVEPLTANVDGHERLRGDELDLLSNAERGEVEVEELDVVAVSGYVDCGVEGVRPTAKGVRVAAHPRLPLDEQDVLAAPSEACAGRQAAEPATDHDRVVRVARRARHPLRLRRGRRRRRSSSLPATGC